MLTLALMAVIPSPLSDPKALALHGTHRSWQFNRAGFASDLAGRRWHEGPSMGVKFAANPSASSRRTLKRCGTIRVIRWVPKGVEPLDIHEDCPAILGPSAPRAVFPHPCLRPYPARRNDIGSPRPAAKDRDRWRHSAGTLRCRRTTLARRVGSGIDPIQDQ